MISTDIKTVSYMDGNVMLRNICLFLGSMTIFLFLTYAAQAGEWRHPLGLSYVSGFSDIMDVMEKNKEIEGYDVDSFLWPIGISYHPYYQIDGGLGIGFGIGPIQLIMGDLELYNFPISVDVRYKLLPESNISPYGRAGIAYNIVSGDYVDSSKAGFLGGIGVEFNQQSVVGWGIEVLYNASEIKMEKYTGSGWDYRLDGTEEIKPEVQISVFVIF